MNSHFDLLVIHYRWVVPHMQGWSYMLLQTIHNLHLTSESASFLHTPSYYLQCQTYSWPIQQFLHQGFYVENRMCARDHLQMICWRQQSNDACLSSGLLELYLTANYGTFLAVNLFMWMLHSDTIVRYPYVICITCIYNSFLYF